MPVDRVRTKGIVDLKLDKDGKLEVPIDFAKAGWYAAGPTPGESGRHRGPCGQQVRSRGVLPSGVPEEGGRSGHSAAWSARRHDSWWTAPRATPRLPSRQQPSLATPREPRRSFASSRGGAFDESTRHYVDSIVAFAHLIA